MAIRRGAVKYSDRELRDPLHEGDTIACLKCGSRHSVKRDPRQGTSINTETGEARSVPNDVLFVECPLAPGPIVVGMNGRRLPEPLELTPRVAPTTH